MSCTQLSQDSDQLRRLSGDEQPLLRLTQKANVTLHSYPFRDEGSLSDTVREIFIDWPTMEEVQR